MSLKKLYMIKSYTDLEQSKKLAEILPLENADYCWGIDDETLHYNNSPYPCSWKDYTCKEYYIPCWSLAALLGVLDFPCLTQINENEWEVCVFDHDNDNYINKTASSPVDACVAMIEKLHERKIL